MYMISLKFINKPLSVPGKSQGTLILWGNSNCFGFIELAASIKMSIGDVFDFFVGFMNVLSVEHDLLLLVRGKVFCVLAYIQL